MAQTGEVRQLNIAVCMKTVPQTVGRLRVSEDRDKVVCESSLVAVNESDSYALEEAMALKQQYGGEVIAVTAGTLKSQEALYSGLARGADRAVRVDVEPAGPSAAAGALALAINRIGPDLVLTGVESWDTLAAQTGVCLAMKLGIPYAYGVTQVELLDPGQVRVVKEMGGGTYQELEVSLPALLCIQSGIRPVDYIPVVKVMQARRRPVESMAPSDMGASQEGPGQARWFEIVDVFSPQRARRVQFLQGKAPDLSQQLMDTITRAMS